MRTAANQNPREQLKNLMSRERPPTPERRSSMANRTGGGVILFGLNEETDFKSVGVGDAHRLQEDLASPARQLARLVLPIKQLGQRGNRKPD
jgi:hypothetical protein